MSDAGGKRILICGGRDFEDEALFRRAMFRAMKTWGIKELCQGGARGADRIALFWAINEGYPVMTYPARWKALGGRAGPERNARMLDHWDPDIVLAFPGGRGTRDMVNAYEAGAANLPFAVFRGYIGVDLPKVNANIRSITCPYTGEALATVPAVRPDVSIIHALRADREGNVLLEGIVGVQKEAVLAAKRSIVTVEEVVEDFGPRNANDGTASYHLFLGLWRIVCLNGLVSDGKIVSDCRVSHSGKRERVLENVIEGTYRVLGEKDLVLNEVEQWRGITLDRQQALAYGAGVRQLRFGDAEGNLTPQGEAIAPEALIRPRRIEDRGTDLFTLFNVAQEHTLKGGITGVARNADGQRRAFTTRPINGVEDDVKVNRALWAFTKALAEAA